MSSPRPAADRARPTVEHLEDRTVPAGNVQVFVEGGVLFLIGDAAANRVSIAKTGERSAFVRPLDSDTTLNGELVKELGVGDITRGYDVKLFGGDDVVVITNVLAKAGLRVEGGDGDDQIFLEGVTSRRQTDIFGGAGNDTLTVTGSELLRRTAIDLGDGDDRASVGSTTLGRDTYIVGGTGTNTLGLEDDSYRVRLASVTGFSPVLQTLLPIATNDTASVAAGQSVKVAVTANDRATSGRIDPASIVILRGPASGTATANADGTITYVSTSAVATTDTLRYIVRNTGGAISNEATVTISVSGPATSPPPTSPPPTSPPPTSPPPTSPPPTSPPPVADTTPPGVSVATTAPSPTNTTSYPFTVTFTEDVIGFTLSDVQLANGTAANFMAVDGHTYTFTVSPTISNGTVSVSVPSGVATDAAGNANTSSFAVGIVYDTIPPEPTVSTTAPDPTSDNPIPFSVTFDDPVVGFSLSDMTVTNGSIINFVAVDSRNYTFDVVPASAADVSVRLLAGVAQDPAGNGSLASNTVFVAYSGTVTTPTIDTIAPDPTNASPIPFTVTFDGDVTGFTASDLTVTNGTVSNFMEVDPQNYTFDVTPTADGTVTVAIAAGVALDITSSPTAAATPVSIVSDRTAPTAAFSTTAPNPTFLATVPFTVTFSEDVTGFDLLDLSLTNGTASNFVAVNGHTYTFSITPAADGLVTVTVLPAVVLDGAGNTNAATSTGFTSIRTDAGMTNTMPAVSDPNWVATSSGLKTWDIQAGSGTAVTSGSNITIFYTGWLTDGTVFDSRRSPSTPITFALSGLIAGWKEGLLGMQPGGIRRLLIPPELAYGVNGAPPNIPPNATLVFEIKLVNVA